MAQQKTIHVYVSGGVVNDVTNLPIGWNWELHDSDEEKEEPHFCPIGDHTVYGNNNVELLDDNTTPCHDCLNKQND